MANPNFVLRFTINGTGRNKGKVCLEIKIKRTTTRDYIRVNELLGTDLSNWDNKQGQFLGLDNETSQKNLILNNLKANVESLFDIPYLNLLTPTDVRRAFEAGEHIEAKKVITFGELLEEVICREKKIGSSNFQRYVTLRNKINGIGHKQDRKDIPVFQGQPITEIPVKEISNNVGLCFYNWVIEHPSWGAQDLVKHFVSTFNKANTCFSSLDIQYKLMFPNNIKQATRKKEKKEIGALTPSEMDIIKSFDPSLVAPPQECNKAKAAIYFDSCLFMYYAMMRDIDVIKLKWDNIEINENGWWLSYSPHKLRNKEGVFDVRKVKLQPQAIKILKKYIGINPNGYVFPFVVNNTDWDKITDFQEEGVEAAHDWYKKINKTEGCINRYLKKIQKHLGIKKNLTMYLFRHSAITHAIDKGILPDIVAKMAGTSSKMIYKHYYDKYQNDLAFPS